MTRDIDDPHGRIARRTGAARPAADLARLLAAPLLLLLLAVVPTTLPLATHAPTWVGPLPTPGAASLQPAWLGAPPLLDVPLGQRQRTEQACGRCHQIEDRRQPPPTRGAAVMT